MTRTENRSFFRQKPFCLETKDHIWGVSFGVGDAYRERGTASLWVSRDPAMSPSVGSGTLGGRTKILAAERLCAQNERDSYIFIQAQLTPFCFCPDLVSLITKTPGSRDLISLCMRSIKPITKLVKALSNTKVSSNIHDSLQRTTWWRLPSISASTWVTVRWAFWQKQQRSLRKCSTLLKGRRYVKVSKWFPERATMILPVSSVGCGL